VLTLITIGNGNKLRWYKAVHVVRTNHNDPFIFLFIDPKWLAVT